MTERPFNLAQIAERSIVVGSPPVILGGDAPRAAGRLYLIQCAVTNLVKIGIAADTQQRLHILQKTSPTPLRLLMDRAGSRADERALHIRFATVRSHGEWFALTDADIQSIVDDGY